MPTPTPFLVLADGAAPRVERLEWLTDVQIARDGTEHRRALRALPRWSQSGQVALWDSYRWSDWFGGDGALMYGEPVLAPAWMHQFEPAGSTLSDGLTCDALAPMPLENPIIGTVPRVAPFMVMPRTGGPSRVQNFTVEADRRIKSVSESPSGFNATTDGLALPMLEMRCREVLAVTVHRPGMRSMQLTLEATEPPHENLPAWTTKYMGLYPYLPSAAPGGRINWRDGMRRQYASSAIEFDAGHLWSRDVQHTKATLTATVSLLKRTDIFHFRRFLYALKGRANTFVWEGPEGYPGLYRLAHDAVELRYSTPSIAECELTVVAVSQ